MKKKPSNGVWQSSPTIISNTSSSTSGGNSASRIGVSGNTVVAVWGQGGKYRYNTSTNAGTSWANVRELDSQYSHPYIATNTNGKLIVGYTTGDPNYVKVAVWNGNSFSISTVAQGKTGPYGFLANPTAAVSPDGSEHVAWRDADKGGIYYGTRGVNGGQWAVTKLNASTANDTVGISSDSQGGLHLAWATNTPAGLYYMYKSPSGSWTNPTFVANTSGKLWNAAKTAGTSQNGIYGHAVVEAFHNFPEVFATNVGLVQEPDGDLYI
jgi:hypothetical protein